MRHALSLTLAALILCCAAAPASAQKPDYSKIQVPAPARWVRDAVIYEVFPRAFSPEGTLAGVTAQLDRLKDLGVTIIWLMPIHPIGKLQRKGTLGSPYSVQDFYAINPEYGTKEDLLRLVAGAHRRGMRVIVDLVANHTAWDSVMMKTPGFYTRDESGKVVAPVADWADVADLNYDDPALRRYMIDMMKFWVRDFDLDGFRCDVAAMVPTDFWEEARAELEKVKPEIVMLAEADEPALLVKAFDLDYSWNLMHTLDAVIMGGASASRLREEWEDERRRYPGNVTHMRFTDNHDQMRAIARYGERGALAASAFIFTIDGVPMLYNGMEVGDTAESGWPALFERVPIFWQTAERRPDFPRFYAWLTRLRAAHPALRWGDFDWLRNSDESRVVTYARRDGAEELVVAINFSNRPFVGLVESSAGGVYQDISPDLSTIERGRRPGALPFLDLGPYEFRVLRRARG
jgi:glycosidase